MVVGETLSTTTNGLAKTATAWAKLSIQLADKLIELSERDSKMTENARRYPDEIIDTAVLELTKSGSVTDAINAVEESFK